MAEGTVVPCSIPVAMTSRFAPKRDVIVPDPPCQLMLSVNNQAPANMLKSSQIFPSKQFFSRWLQGEGGESAVPAVKLQDGGGESLSRILPPVKATSVWQHREASGQVTLRLPTYPPGLTAVADPPLCADVFPSRGGSLAGAPVPGAGIIDRKLR